MINTDNKDSGIITNHTNQRHPRSIANWKYYYVTLVVWLVLLIGTFYELSIAFS